MNPSIKPCAFRIVLALGLLSAAGWLHAAGPVVPEPAKLLKPVLKAPVALAALAAPQNFTAVGSVDGVQLSWQVVDGAASYLVLRGTGAAPAEPALASLLPMVHVYLDKGFNAAASYQVVAVAADGRRGASAVVSYQPPAPVKMAQAMALPPAVSKLAVAPVRQVATALPVPPPPAPMSQTPPPIKAGALATPPIVATGAKAGLVTKGLSPYTDAGSGPIVDVTDWQPKARAASGAEVVLQGRALQPGNLRVFIGATQLQAGAQSATEARFRIPADLQTASDPLVVYHAGGQTRSLEASYVVFNPNVAIASITPNSFRQGDTVTISGTSLQLLTLFEEFADFTITTVPAKSSLSLQPGKGMRLTGDRAVRAVNLQLSASGDRLTFQVGDLYEVRPVCLTTPCNNNVLGSVLSPMATVASFANQPTLPATYTGQPWFVSTAGKITGPSVTWSQGGATLTKAYGFFFGMQEPLIIPPGSVAAPGIRPSMGSSQVQVEGSNLKDAACKVGNTVVNLGFSQNETAFTKGSMLLAANSAGGQVCCSKNGASSCAPTPIQVIAPPTITRVPAMPLALGVSHTIEGINLLPPANSGLSYRFDMYGLGASATTVTSFNQVMQVLEHTAQRIVFRVGDPATPMVLPSNYGTGAEFVAPASAQAMDTTPYQMRLWASYQGKAMGLWSNYFYLKPWSVPTIRKFEAKSDLATVLSNVNQDPASNPAGGLAPIFLSAGKPLTLSWDLGTAPYDSAEITPDIGPLNAATGSRVVTPADSRRYLLTAKKGSVTTRTGIDVYVNPPPTIGSFDCISLINPPPAGISYYKAGTQGELRWSIGYSWTSISINPGAIYTKSRTVGSPNSADSGSLLVNPGASTTYTLAASNQYGQSTKTCTLAALPPTTIAEFSVTPARIRAGESATLSWRIEGLAGYVTGLMQPSFFPGGSVTLPSLSGSQVFTPTATQQIRLEARGFDSLSTPVSRTITIEVTP